MPLVICPSGKFEVLPLSTVDNNQDFKPVFLRLPSQIMESAKEQQLVVPRWTVWVRQVACSAEHSPRQLLSPPADVRFFRPLSIVKSNLQKAVRRGHVYAAAHSALHLLQAGHAVELIRRLFIIAIEDVGVPDGHDLTRLAYLLVAASSTSYDVHPVDDWLFLIALAVRLASWREKTIIDMRKYCFSQQEVGQFIKQFIATDDMSKLREFWGDDQLSLMIRACYGGMGGDMALLLSFIRWSSDHRQQTNSAPRMPAVAKLILPSSDDGGICSEHIAPLLDTLRKGDGTVTVPRDLPLAAMLSAAVDMHCSSMTSILKDRHGLQPSIAKEWIWRYRSGINFRELDILACQQGHDVLPGEVGFTEIGADFTCFVTQLLKDVFGFSHAKLCDVDQMLTLGWGPGEAPWRRPGATDGIDATLTSYSRDAWDNFEEHLLAQKAAKAQTAKASMRHVMEPRAPTLFHFMKPVGRLKEPMVNTKDTPSADELGASLGGASSSKRSQGEDLPSVKRSCVESLPQVGGRVQNDSKQQAVLPQHSKPSASQSQEGRQILAESAVVRKPSIIDFFQKKKGAPGNEMSAKAPPQPALQAAESVVVDISSDGVRL